LDAVSSDRLVIGHFGGDTGEEVVVRRWTDDAVELHCHGGSAAVAMIEALLVAAGCRRIEWRDWIDAAQLDPFAIAALKSLADAPTQRTAAILLDQYHGAIHRAMAEIRQEIDRGQTETARQQIDALLDRAALGRHLVQPWRVVLAGQVNVGKSSLVNALVGFHRSIVHPMPGATRDAVAVATAIEGWPVELCDTAGLRDGCENQSIHEIEWAGIERTRERLAQADLVILIFDHSAPWSAEDQALLDRWPEALLVHNKCDLPRTSDRPIGIPTSAIDGHGIDVLLKSIAQRLVPNPPPDGAAVPFATEQIESIESLRNSWAI
jgi:tRNA modification GTPase